MAEKTVKEKAAPVAPAVAPVVLGVGAAVKNGLSAVIESIEDIPSEMARLEALALQASERRRLKADARRRLKAEASGARKRNSPPTNDSP